MKLESHLRAGRDGGRKLLVPYVTGGLDGWTDVVNAVVDAGADAVEIGIPFSDPVMDGPTIQAASQAALARGATPTTILAEARLLDIDVPLAVMTYCNVAFHAGRRRFAQALAEAGIDGAILPDLPLGEIDEWAAAADDAGVETVMLAAPNSTDERLRAIAARTRGFLYAVALMGVTGQRDDLAAQAVVTGRRAKAVTDVPVLLGVGISTPEQAAEAASAADGVVVGSALIARLLAGEGPEGAHSLIAAFRAALDEVGRPRGAGATSGYQFADDCDLCEAARITPWFHEDDICWIAECEICAVPMVVWRGHGTNPPPAELEHMHTQLAEVVTVHFTFEHYVDDNMRNIPDHYHAHARPKGGFFGHGLRRRTD